MSTYASDYSGGLGAGLGSGLGNLGFGVLREPPLSPPMAQAPSTTPAASFETNGNGNGTGLIAPLTDQPLHGLLGGSALATHDPVAALAPPAAETTGEAPSLPFVDLRAFAIDRSAARLIPEQVANVNTALPIGFEQGLPLVAIAEASEPTMEGVLAALGCDARFVLASRTDLVASIAAAYTAPAAGAIRLATPVGIEPPTVAEVAPPAEETMSTVAPVAPVAPIAPIGGLELAPVAPAETEEHAPAEQVELAPVAPAEIAPVLPIAPVEAPLDQPAALETDAPVDVAPVTEPATFDTVAPIDVAPVAEPAALEKIAPIEADAPIAEPAVVGTVAAVEAAAPVEHFAPTPLSVEPVAGTATDQIADGPETETTSEAAETTPTTRFRVVIRLSGAEPVEAGDFDAVGEAKDRAFEIVGQLTSENGSWPYFRGRYLRPDAIVSVDIVEETAW
jgi:MshEN domain